MITLARRGVLCAGLLLAAAAHGGDCGGWSEWQRFSRLYLSADGRVVDAATQGITVSEGQAYALLFALVANDEGAFARILEWTRNNLAAGDLARSLPAWKWGRSEDGRWTVLDANSASDADLWTVYALGEAARLWRNDTYAKTARAMSDLILRDEVAFVPGLGATLLPAPKGFVTAQAWRLNPSYVPLQVLRAVSHQSGNKLWDGVIDSSVRIIVASAPHGYAADWLVYRVPEGFLTDAATRGSGSYDAIRVYLWAGMLPDDDPEAAVLALKLAPAAARAAERPFPESIDTDTLETHGEASPGYLAALLPSLVRFKFTSSVQAYRQEIEARALKDDQHYYSDVLSLFGLGWLDDRYRFDRQGRLQVGWTASCRAR